MLLIPHFSLHFDLSILTDVPDPGLKHHIFFCHTDQIVGSSTDDFSNQTSVEVLYQLINIEDFTLNIVLSKVLPIKFGCNFPQIPTLFGDLHPLLEVGHHHFSCFIVDCVRNTSTICLKIVRHGRFSHLRSGHSLYTLCIWVSFTSRYSLHVRKIIEFSIVVP